MSGRTNLLFTPDVGIALFLVIDVGLIRIGFCPSLKGSFMVSYQLK